MKAVPNNECASMLIEALNVSEQCLDGLRRSGFSTIGELAEFFEQTWGGRGNTVDPHPYFVLCVEQVVIKLKEIGCWPESLAGE